MLRNPVLVTLAGVSRTSTCQNMSSAQQVQRPTTGEGLKWEKGFTNIREHRWPLDQRYLCGLCFFLQNQTQDSINCLQHKSYYVAFFIKSG